MVIKGDSKSLNCILYRGYVGIVGNKTETTT